MEGQSIRVRFAPSPTGMLHVGNARTALYNWLFARRSGGKFVIRVEDTDVDRSKPNYEKHLLQELVWLGLNWDEGPNENDASETGDRGPYRQSKRMETYATHTAQLLAEGKAYRCFCTPEELEEERQLAIAEGRPQVYSGRCRVMNKFDVKENLLRGKTYSIRLQIPDRPIRFHDAIRGDLEFAPETISDPVLVRSAQGGTAGASPGVPVYNYVVTVDDALMGITHVIRGDDHIANTPKQVAIYEAFGWKVPEFVHLPTIVGPDRERLSKRHGATSMSGFREMGYLPEALVNHLALLGWTPKDAKSEILNPDQLVAAFSFEDIAASPAIFDFEKLNALNRHYLKLATPARLAALCWDYFGGLLPEKEETPDAVLVWFFHMIAMFLPSVNRLGEIPAKAAFIFHMNPNLARADEANAAILAADSARRVIYEISAKTRTKPGPLTAADFNAWMSEISSTTGISGNELYDPVRIALTGSTSCPEFTTLIPVLDQGAALDIGIPSVGQRLAAFL
ncbi:glutamate--tRNA ligase [Occallatibacter savannae]|uniref:glutamate--tRNA ligase n=1 Tax=Occallatibacter savannae TaxID=1002691 RepID=UPI000D68DFA2|nr:glutamate--tRNA ligase [Occallatibacter savannae]